MLDAFIDLPFIVSPVIIGLALILVYGQDGWFGDWFTKNGIQIIYAVPGMVLATIFVSLPFVVREVAPVLIEVGDEQEQAAATLGASGWQTFWRVTLPSIRWGVAYGVVLTTARALGEIGAVLVVSSNVAGSTLTLPLLVYQRYSQIGAGAIPGAYAAATELAVLSLLVLLVMTVLAPERTTPDEDRHRPRLEALRGVHGARRRDPRGPGGLADRAARTERLGQVDAAADHRRARDAGHRRRSRSTATTSPALGRRSAASASCSSTTPRSRT